MIFLTPGTEPAVVANLARHLVPDGLLVAGFQLGYRFTPAGAQTGGLALADYDAIARSAGLELVERWATWDCRPWQAGGIYAVSVHRRHAAAAL